MWGIIALAYMGVTPAYGAALANDSIQDSVTHGLEHGGLDGAIARRRRRIATGNDSALQHVFHASHELAASCGILLWLVTFVSMVPIGLVLAHRERLSLRKLSEESEKEDARAELSPFASSLMPSAASR